MNDATPETVFEFWRALPIIISAIGQVGFISFYSLRKLGAGEWWKISTGRALFTKSVTMTILLVSINIAYLHKFLAGEYSGVAYGVSRYGGDLEYLVVIGYWLVVIGVYYQLWALVNTRFLLWKRLKARFSH